MLDIDIYKHWRLWAFWCIRILTSEKYHNSCENVSSTCSESANRIPQDIIHLLISSVSHFSESLRSKNYIAMFSNFNGPVHIQKYEGCLAFSVA